jgi:hypothetical protein
MGKNWLAFFLAALSMPAFAGYDRWIMPPAINFNLSEETLSCLEKSNYQDVYEISGRINPVYLRADLNGDGKMGDVVFIQRIRDKKDGLLICHPAGKSQILFAGNHVRHIGGHEKSSDDLSRVDYWFVYTGSLGSGFEGAPPPPRAKGEVISIGRMETWSMALYWTGKNYLTYLIGD